MRHLLLAPLLVLLFAAPAHADPWWSGPQVLGQPEYDYILSAPPTVTSNASGAAIALTHDRQGRLFVQRAAVGRPFGPRRAVPRGGGDATVTALADDGTAALAWLRYDGSHRDLDEPYEDCCQRVIATVQSADGRFAPARQLSAPGGDAQSLHAVARSDRFALAWSDARGVAVATGRPGHGFGRVTRLGPAAFVLGVWLDGDTPHAITREYRRGPDRIRERWASGGRVRHRSVIGTLPELQGDAAAEVGPTGALVVSIPLYGAGSGPTWVGYAAPGRRMHLHRIALRTDLRAPNAAVALMGAAGGAMLAFGDRHGRVVLRRVSPDGRVGAPRRIRLLGGARAESQSDLALAVDATGKGVVAGYAYRRYARAGYDGWVYQAAATFDPEGSTHHVLRRARESFQDFGVTALLAPGGGRVAFAGLGFTGPVRAYRFRR